MFKLRKKQSSTSSIMRRKRQWGSEKRTDPLPWLHERPSLKKLTLSRLAIFLTIFFWMAYIFSILLRQLFDNPQGYNFTMEAFIYTTVVTLLTFSALMYLIARLGAYERFTMHTRVPHAILERHFAKHPSTITVLVPSYDEEPEVIRKTLLSAALQEFPEKRIMLLLDDNPNPTDPVKLARLNRTRQLSSEIIELLEKPRERFNKALATFEAQNPKQNSSKATITRLAKHYEWAADFLTGLAEQEAKEDHVDIFFNDNVLKDLSDDLKLVSIALHASVSEGAQLSRERVHLLFKRLTWIFSSELGYFERKRYASLSQEANKAMNINSYIGLMGGSFRQEQSPDGILLLPVKRSQPGDLIIKDSEYLLTLDADSILLRDYCLRLVYLLEQPGNERVAVTQTPYSSFRGAFTRIERLAGATTDVQHILHQGMSKFGATFWVGANAVIRKKALEEMVQTEWVGGFEIKKYIQDRTVIEDTESSIDMALKGWSIVNYPERLSYSATPPDFGSLVIQRRRWANGGLLILPKLWSMIRKRQNSNDPVSRIELMLRINYMASIAWASFGLIFLLAYPFNGQLLSILVLCTALPYFIAMAVDLKYCRYSYWDIFSIYGFNLILLPVNLAGVIKSIEQAMTGKKIPFARTPKIKNRTAASLLYVVFPIAIIVFSLYIFYVNFTEANWGNAAFAAFNAIAATWAVIAYIGLGQLIYDIFLGIKNWFYVDVKAEDKSNTLRENQSMDWKAVLYHGERAGSVPHSSLSNLVVNAAGATKGHKLQ